MINFGIVGFGLHAVKRLMPGFALAGNCRVVALSRRDIGKARESAKRYQIPLAFDSAEELCRHPQVDAVFVTTPNACHLQDVLLAIKYRKPVLCEKPMAINADQCRQMVEAARAAKVPLGVAQVFRFEDSILRLREHLAAGKIGRPIFVRSEFSFLGGPQHPRVWLRDQAVSGGGPIADVGVHCVDALRFILQNEVSEVSARCLSDRDAGEVESAAALTLEFSSGILAVVTVSFRAEYRTPMELVGHAGVLWADNVFNVEAPIHIEIRRGGSIAQTETVSNKFAYARQVDAFAAAVEDKAQFPAPGEEGWQNQEILDAAYRSAANGKMETVRRITAGVEAKHHSESA